MPYKGLILSVLISPMIVRLIISGVVNEQALFEPIDSPSAVIVKHLRVSRMAPLLLNFPTLIFGPCRSKNMPICLFNFLERLRTKSMSSLMFSLF